MVMLDPDLEFVSKTHALDAVAEPIKLRDFTSVGTAEIERKLCPVRSLLQYRKATTTPECRKGRKKLFISYKPAKSDEIPAQACDIIRFKNLALNIRDCLSLCLSEETLKPVGPFYLVSMPGEVKDPTSPHWKCVTCGLHNTTL